MRKIANIIFKIHIFLFGYPCRSQIRLALEDKNCHYFGLVPTIAMLYICGEGIDGISDWTGLDKKEVKELLNDIVQSMGDL